MPRKTSPCTLTPEEAGEFLGIDAQTLRLCLRAGYYGDIGRAIKTDPRNECYTYEISKHKLFDYLGLDVTVDTQTALQMVRDGHPPYKEKRVTDMVYISERITNLHEYEKTIAMCRTFYDKLVYATDTAEMEHALQSLNDELSKLENFDFCIEKRKVDYCE